MEFKVYVMYVCMCVYIYIYICIYYIVIVVAVISHITRTMCRSYSQKQKDLYNLKSFFLF